MPVLIGITIVMGILLLVFLTRLALQEKRAEKGKREVNPSILCTRVCCCQTKLEEERNGHRGGSH